MTKAPKRPVSRYKEIADLKKELRKKSSQLEILSKVSSAAASNLYLNEIMQMIVSMTAEVLDSRVCSIMLLDEGKGELVIMATQSLSDEYRNKPPTKIGQSISGLAIKEKKPKMVLDVTTEKGYMYPEIAKKEGLRSMLSVPMMIKDKAIGVVNTYTSTEHKFTEDEIKLLQAVANQAALSIENTKLFNKAAAMEEALDVRKAVERAKGILMKEKSISENEAFRLIQRQSMNTRKSMKEIAEAIILANEIRK